MVSCRPNIFRIVNIIIDLERNHLYDRINYLLSGRMDIHTIKVAKKRKSVG